MWTILGEKKLNSEPESQQEKEERKRQVWNLVLQGYTQQQIAEKFNVSLKTISRDFHELKKESAEWMETLPKGQIQMYHKSNFEVFEKVNMELWKLYEQTEDEKLKLKILNTIAEKRKLQVYLLDPKHLLQVRESIHNELAPKTSLTDIMTGVRTQIDFENIIK